MAIGWSWVRLIFLRLELIVCSIIILSLLPKISIIIEWTSPYVGILRGTCFVLLLRVLRRILVISWVWVESLVLVPILPLDILLLLIVIVFILFEILVDLIIETLNSLVPHLGILSVIHITSSSLVVVALAIGWLPLVVWRLVCIVRRWLLLPRRILLPMWTWSTIVSLVYWLSTSRGILHVHFRVLVYQTCNVIISLFVLSVVLVILWILIVFVLRRTASVSIIPVMSLSTSIVPILSFAWFIVLVLISWLIAGCLKLVSLRVVAQVLGWLTVILRSI